MDGNDEDERVIRVLFVWNECLSFLTCPCPHSVFFLKAASSSHGAVSDHSVARALESAVTNRNQPASQLAGWTISYHLKGYYGSSTNNPPP
jgi:hypothetical protein